MKRAHGHLAFVVVALALGAVTVAESIQLQHAQRINAAVAEWRAMPSSKLPDAQGPAPSTDAASTAVTTPAAAASPAVVASPTIDHLPPEARLARAVALSRVDYDAALAAYKAIIQSNREDLRRIALYDLGNLHLRQAIQYGLADQAQSLPLTELAKQSYRDLLRKDPTDWDARYNLERALRLAPEEDDDANDDSGPPDPREHDRTTIADPRMDLP
jgi:tetratricopeptide (TPR) repeat protein